MEWRRKMKAHGIKEQYKINYIIDQLHTYNYYDTDGKTLRELTAKLAALRASDVKVESPHSSWF